MSIKDVFKSPSSPLQLALEIQNAETDKHSVVPAPQEKGFVFFRHSKLNIWGFWPVVWSHLSHFIIITVSPKISVLLWTHTEVSEPGRHNRIQAEDSLTWYKVILRPQPKHSHHKQTLTEKTTTIHQ